MSLFTHSKIYILLILISVLLLASMPSCSAVTLTYVDGTWGSATGTTPCYRNTDDTSDENTVAWPSADPCPNPKTDTSHSGYGFDGEGTQEILPGAIIKLGTFCHYNRPVSSSISSVDLSVYLNFEGTIVGPITYTINHEETSNGQTCPGGICPTTGCCIRSGGSWRCNPTGTCTSGYCSGTPVAARRCCGQSGAWDDTNTYCKYTPCDSPCPDKPSFPSSSSSVTFTVEGKSYTLEMLGFADCNDPSKPINYFITQEGASNCACLYGRITGNTPSIFVEKRTNNIHVLSASDPNRPTISSGCPVTWTYLVTNDGNVDLSSVSVTDSKPGVTPVDVDANSDGYNDGDTDKDHILDLTEMWTYTATGTAISCSPGCECDYSNTATATASGGSTSVSDTDPSYYHAVTTTVNAGADQAICEIPGTVPLTGLSSCAPSGVTYKWTTSGTGTFSPNNALSTTYTIGAGDIPTGQASGQVTLTLTATGTCPSAITSDSMVLTVVDKPIAQIQVLAPL